MAVLSVGLMGPLPVLHNLCYCEMKTLQTVFKFLKIYDA